MKHTILTTVIALALSLAAAKADYQLTFNTANDASSNFVLDVGGATRLDSTFFGQLYVGADANSLVAIGTAKQFGFIGGNAVSGANGFIFSDVVLSGASAIVAGNTAVYQLRAWKGASDYATALTTIGAKVGSSASASIVVQGPPSLSTPPNTSLHTGFTLSTVAVPEPATMALGLFGAAGLFLRRRK